MRSITPAQRAAKRAAGLCTANIGCQGKTTRWVLCDAHHEAWGKHKYKIQRDWYYEKKEMGLCTYETCKEPARDDANMCFAHQLKKNQYSSRMAKTKKRRRQLTRAQKRYRAGCIARGHCVRCPRPLATETMCEVHRREKNARHFKARKDTHQSHDKCSNCKEPGHRAPTCQKRSISMPSIDFYATARNHWEAA